ncbi:MAG: hypothetical protein NTV00_10845 [Methylococcales bacterium]|nr:hypothetical protein [Methylococcales bacterium]
MKKFLAPLLIASLVTIAPLSHADYNFATLSHPKATAGTFPSGLNDNKQVAGYYIDTTGTHGFIYDGSDYSTIDSPNATETYLTGINNSGQISGYFFDGSNNHAFVYINNNFIPLNIPNSRATGIANNGLVVGSFNDTSGPHGFVYNGGVYKVINFPNSLTTLTGINSNEQIIGSFTEVNIVNGSYYLGNQGNFYYDGIYHAGINYPNADSSIVSTLTGINDRGEIIGKSNAINFIYSGSNYIAIDLPATDGKVTVGGINNNEIVTGFTTKENNSVNYINGRPYVSISIDKSGFTATPNNSVSLTPLCHPNVTYNFWSHELIMQDVLVAGTHYFAKLTDQGNDNFQLIEAHPITAGTCPDSTVIQYFNNSVIIPTVLAYGNNYNITLVKNKDTSLYSIAAYSIK